MNETSRSLISTSRRRIFQNDNNRQRRKERFAAHVSALASALESVVQTSLTQEAEEVARNWVENAQHVQAWLVSAESDANTFASLDNACAEDDQPVLGADGLDTMPSVEAWNSAQLQITDSLKREAPFFPDEDEVLEHAQELAQLLLSNWFSILENALDESQDESVALIDGMLPIGIPDTELQEGCHAFAVPASHAIVALNDYVKSMADQGDIDLSPTLAIHVGMDGQRHIRRPTNVEANEISKSPAQTTLEEVVALMALEPQKLAVDDNTWMRMIAAAAQQAQEPRTSIAKTYAHPGRVPRPHSRHGTYFLQKRLADLVMEDIANTVSQELKLGVQYYNNALEPRLGRNRLLHAEKVYGVALPATTYMLIMSIMDDSLRPVDMTAFSPEQMQIVSESAGVAALVISNSQKKREDLGYELSKLTRSGAISAD